jgi:hypothetical protein
MKKLIILVALAVGFISPSFAQLRTTIRSTIQQGNYIDFPGSYFPTSAASIPASSASDTLQVSDTVAYVIPITHLNDVDVFLQWYWNKSGSGTAGITVTFYQSNDPYNFTTGSQLTSGVAKTAYSKVYSLTASGWNYLSFKQDSVNFEGRYLKVQYLTSATASVGGKVFSRLKSTIK